MRRQGASQKGFAVGQGPGPATPPARRRVPGAVFVEEALRLESPVQGMLRREIGLPWSLDDGLRGRPDDVT